MQPTTRTFLGATVGFALLTLPALADERPRLAGLWRLGAFYAEDVATKARTHIYGERPLGFMGVGVDGRFDAWAISEWPYRDSRQGEPTVGYRAILYSGRYRVENDRLLVNVNQVQHEGFYSDPVHIIWNEFQTRTDETRSFRLEQDELGNGILCIETMPMAEPNGTGALIVGTVIWVRSHEWDEATR